MNKFFNFLLQGEARPSWLLLLLVLVQSAIGFVFLPLWAALLILLLALLASGLSFNRAYSLVLTTQALILEKNQNSSTLNTLAEGIILYDQDFKVFSFNRAAEIIIGIRKEEVLNQVVTPEWANNDHLRLLTQIMFPSLAPVVIRKTVSTYPQVVEIRFSEPRELYLEVTTNQVFEETGKLIGFIKIIRDKSREVQLAKTKSEFITVAAHQLRTPLSGVHWALEMLGKGDLGELNEQQLKTVKDSLATTERLAKIVDDLLNVAKLEEGKFGYQFEKVDLVELIQELLPTYTEQAQQASVKVLFFKPEEKFPLITMDKARVTTVVQNLVENAIRYNVPNGEVKISIGAVPGKPYLQVSIEDTGIGISTKDLPKVFSKFFRSEATLRKETEGSGLGLYICKNIIKRHGGEIWVKSVEKRGSTFSFILPTDEKLIPPIEITSEEF